jgi:hypothetical protein
MKTEWNPQYVQYAKVHGRTPDDMLAHDRERWPGGVMTGYILWVSQVQPEVLQGASRLVLLRLRHAVQLGGMDRSMCAATPSV